MEKGALHKKLNIPEDEKIPVSVLNDKIKELKEKAEGDKKLTDDQRKFLQQLIFAKNARKFKKEDIETDNMLELLKENIQLYQEGMGRMGGPYKAGPGGTCICPKCKTEVCHTTGRPCKSMNCPNCGTILIRNMVTEKSKCVKENYDNTLHEAFFGLIKVPIVDEVLGTIQDTAETVIKGIGETIQTTGKVIKGGSKLAQGKIGSSVKDMANASDRAPTEQLSKSVADKKSVMDWLKNHKNAAWVTAGLLSTGLLATLAAKVYKAYFTKAAKACAKAINKLECIRKYKMDAIKGIIGELEKSKSKYNTLPEIPKKKALARIDKEIAKQKSKMYKIAS